MGVKGLSYDLTFLHHSVKTAHKHHLSFVARFCLSFKCKPVTYRLRSEGGKTSMRKHLTLPSLNASFPFPPAKCLEKKWKSRSLIISALDSKSKTPDSSPDRVKTEVKRQACASASTLAERALISHAKFQKIYKKDPHHPKHADKNMKRA